MKKTLICLLAMCTVVTTQAQNSNKQRACPSDHIIANKIATDANYKAKYEAIEKHTQLWINTYSNANNTSKTTSAPQVTIPVVVHIIYNTAEQNISDAQVLSQIDALNKDFRRLNADAVNTPAIFQSVAADCEIEFCLAKRDALGYPTNGITRTSTIVDTFKTKGLNPNYTNVYYTSPAWDATKYLNIWVCNFDIHGLSTFPSDVGTVGDGIIVRYSSFGTVGANLEPEWMEGGIATHEIGHYLNCEHIFDEVGDCLDGDGISDTPVGKKTYGCPSGTKDSCPSTPLPDMYMNYMDYTDDPCINMFTLGQKAKMLAVFAPGGARESLKYSLGCSSAPCTPPTNITYTSAYKGVPGTSEVTVNWVGYSTYTYHIKIFKWNSVINNWEYLSEQFPTTNSAKFNAIWDNPYKVEVFSKCADGNTSSVTIKDNIMVDGCNQVSNLSYTYSYNGLFERNKVTLNWTGNAGNTYEVKVYSKTCSNNNWFYWETIQANTTTATFDAFWDTYYKIEITSKCPDGSISTTFIKDDIYTEEPTETNNTWATAETVNNLTTATALINGVTKEASICLPGCDVQDIFTFTTFFTNYRNVDIKIPSGVGQMTAVSGDIFLYRQECVVQSNGRLICETDEPTLVASCTGSLANSITYRPCYSKQYRYYVVVKKDLGYTAGSGIYSCFLSYTLNVRLMSDFSPVCLGFGRMAGNSTPEDMLMDKEVVSILSVYPNPGTGKYTVELQPTVGEITISNTLGQQVQTITTDVDKTQYELDISTQPSGIYFMEMKKDGQLIYRTKIIKE